MIYSDFTFELNPIKVLCLLYEVISTKFFFYDDLFEEIESFQTSFVVGRTINYAWYRDEP